MGSKNDKLAKAFEKRFKACGNNFRWYPSNSTFIKPELAEIGDNVFIGGNCHISVHTSLKIEDGVTVGPELIIMGGDHNFNEIGKRLYQVKSDGINLPIVIEKDVWIGARVTILKGVTIREGAVIGAGSVVTKKVPPYTISVGNPARAIKKRFSDEELKLHLNSLGYSNESIANITKERNLAFK